MNKPAREKCQDGDQALGIKLPPQSRDEFADSASSSYQLGVKNRKGISVSARIVAVLTLVVASSNANAQTDAERIRALQNQVEALQRRVEALEGGTRGAIQIAPVVKQGSSKDVRNWRQLRVGMNEQQVEALLGSPVKVDVSRSDFTWYYADFPYGGHVRFNPKSRLAEAWNEPL